MASISAGLAVLRSNGPLPPHTERQSRRPPVAIMRALGSPLGFGM